MSWSSPPLDECEALLSPAIHLDYTIRRPFCSATAANSTGSYKPTAFFAYAQLCLSPSNRTHQPLPSQPAHLSSLRPSS